MTYRVMVPVWTDGVQNDECILETKDYPLALGKALELADCGAWIQERES